MKIVRIKTIEQPVNDFQDRRVLDEKTYVIDEGTIGQVLDKHAPDPRESATFEITYVGYAEAV